MIPMVTKWENQDRDSLAVSIIMIQTDIRQVTATEDFLVTGIIMMTDREERKMSKLYFTLTGTKYPSMPEQKKAKAAV